MLFSKPKNLRLLFQRPLLTLVIGLNLEPSWDDCKEGWSKESSSCNKILLRDDSSCSEFPQLALSLADLTREYHGHGTRLPCHGEQKSNENKIRYEVEDKKERLAPTGRHGCYNAYASYSTQDLIDMAKTGNI